MINIFLIIIHLYDQFCVMNQELLEIKYKSLHPNIL